MPSSFLDALAFSSAWVAAAAALLLAAAARALGVAAAPEALTLAFAGTLVVYNVDRLRDVARDRDTSPARTAFVIAHRPALVMLSAVASLAAVAAAWRAGAGVAALAAGVLALGLAHRRMKSIAFGKAFYIAAAWTTVAVGVPALGEPGATRVAHVAAVVYATLLANAVASSVRDAEAGAARVGLGRALHFARLCAAGALALSLAGGPAARLAWLCGATLAALVFFRPGERYGLLVVDGALVVGSALALLG